MRSFLVSGSFVVALAVMQCGTQATSTPDAGADADVDMCPDSGAPDCSASCPAHFHDGTPCSAKGLVCQGGDLSPPCEVIPIHCTCDGTAFTCLVDCFPQDAGDASD